jgi:hypothetical protein
MPPGISSRSPRVTIDLSCLLFDQPLFMRNSGWFALVFGTLDRQESVKSLSFLVKRKTVVASLPSRAFAAFCRVEHWALK